MKRRLEDEVPADMRSNKCPEQKHHLLTNDLYFTPDAMGVNKTLIYFYKPPMSILQRRIQRSAHTEFYLTYLLGNIYFKLA